MSAQPALEAHVIQACRALGVRLGMGPVEPRVIGRFSNLALWLAPTTCVARVATGTAGPRADLAWSLREIALTQALSEVGCAVPAPASGEWAGPHLQSGWRITLWQRLALTDQRPDPHASGRALAQCHAALATLPARMADTEAPDWWPLDEGARLLTHPEVLARAGEDAAWVLQRLIDLGTRVRNHPAPRQWLHGDAHLNNVRSLAGGAPVWLDWEDACRAPLEWDLAGLVGAAWVLGSEVEWSEAALAGWREVGPPIDEALLDLCIELRALFVVAWSWWLWSGTDSQRSRLSARLAWLRRRAGV